MYYMCGQFSESEVLTPPFNNEYVPCFFLFLFDFFLIFFFGGVGGGQRGGPVDRNIYHNPKCNSPLPHQCTSCYLK